MKSVIFRHSKNTNRKRNVSRETFFHYYTVIRLQCLVRYLASGYGRLLYIPDFWFRSTVVWGFNYQGTMQVISDSVRIPVSRLVPMFDSGFGLANRLSPKAGALTAVANQHFLPIHLSIRNGRFELLMPDSDNLVAYAAKRRVR